jgi:hypothetical protein
MLEYPPNKIEFSATPLWEPKILQICLCMYFYGQFHEVIVFHTIHLEQETQYGIL